MQVRACALLPWLRACRTFIPAVSVSTSLSAPLHSDAFANHSASDCKPCAAWLPSPRNPGHVCEVPNLDGLYEQTETYWKYNLILKNIFETLKYLCRLIHTVSINLCHSTRWSRTKPNHAGLYFSRIFSFPHFFFFFFNSSFLFLSFSPYLSHAQKKRYMAGIEEATYFQTSV